MRCCANSEKNVSDADVCVSVCVGIKQMKSDKSTRKAYLHGVLIMMTAPKHKRSTRLSARFQRINYKVLMNSSFTLNFVVNKIECDSSLRSK